MARNGIIAPMFLTTEPNEYNISGWIMEKREATVLEVNQMEHVATNRTRDIFAKRTSNIKEGFKCIQHHPRVASGCCTVFASRVQF